MTGERLFSRTEITESSAVRPERIRELARARRNVYLPAADVPEDDTGRYRLQVVAAHRTLTGDHVFSHESGMVLLRLPSLYGWPTRVHLVCERRSGGRSQSDVVRHCLGLEHVELWVVDGMLVTSPGRTAFDIALTRPFVDAVVVADAAFRMYPGARAEFAELVETYGRGRGHQRAADVLALADGRSGSVGESYSRTEMDRLGFAKPDLQVKVTNEWGDFGWPAVLVLGEFDGEVKYREDRYRMGGTVEDVVIREKNRENRMRRKWPTIARWDTRDLREHRLEGILRQAAVPLDLDRRRRNFARYSLPPRGR